MAFVKQKLYVYKKNKLWIDFKLKVLKTIEKEHLSFRDSSLKFNIPDTSIILKWKKDFANFGLDVLQPKPRGRPKTTNNNKRKKRKSDELLTYKLFF